MSSEFYKCIEEWAERCKARDQRIAQLEAESAWQVVEKMVADKRLVRVQYNGRHWFCTLTAVNNVVPIVDWEADAAPLAICLAALKASGVEVA